MNINIRSERPEDHAGIRRVNDLAFGQPDEGKLVDNLRKNSRFIRELSIIAEFKNEIIGHILFFPVRIRNGRKSFESLALAPVSVIPAFQKKGIGGSLINKGLETAKNLGFKSVIVLGHKTYYPIFGFIPAASWNIKPPFEVPEGVFMAIELEPEGLKGVSGTIEYPQEFEEVG
jgi:putative acetyltransferase